MKSIEELAKLKKYWLEPERTKEEFEQANQLVKCDGYSFTACFGLKDGILTPHMITDVIVDFINTIAKRFNAPVNVSMYTCGIYEKYQHEWEKDYSEVSGIILTWSQICHGIEYIVTKTSIPYVGIDSRFEKEVLKSMSFLIQNLSSYSNINRDRVIDFNIPIYAKDLSLLMKVLPKARAVTVKIEAPNDLLVLYNSLPSSRYIILRTGAGVVEDTEGPGLVVRLV